jgi:hypothetical protein
MAYGQETLGGIYDYFSNLFSSSGGSSSNYETNPGYMGPPRASNIASDSPSYNYTPTPTAPTTSSGFDIPYKELVTGAAGLAGIYFTQKGNKEMNDAQIQAAKDKLAAELALAGKGKGGGGGGGGGGGNPALEIAKMNNLSAMYQNWAAIQAKAGDIQAQTALETGRNAAAPLIARAQVLR